MWPVTIRCHCARLNGAQTLLDMSAPKPLKESTATAGTDVGAQDHDATAVTRQRLSSAMELLGVAVASVFDNDEIVINNAFVQALGLDEQAMDPLSATLRQSIVTAVANDPVPEHVSWIQGKRSFERDVCIAISSSEQRFWHTRICSIRFNQTTVRQLQLVSPIDAPSQRAGATEQQSDLHSEPIDTGPDPWLKTSQHSQWSFRESVENSEFPMVIRTGTVFKYINPAFANLIGVEKREDLYERELFSILPEREIERLQDKIKRRDSGETVRNGYKLTLRHCDGREVPTRTFSRRIVWNGAASVHSVCIDVTEEDRTNRALVESENRLQTILASLPCGMIVHRNGKALYVNPAMVKMMGYSSAEEVLAQETMWDAFPEHERLKSNMLKRMEGRPESDRYETVLRNLDGTLRNVRVSPETIDWNGERAVLASMTDVTDLTNALNRLRLDEIRSRDFASTAASWFWETDQDDRLTMVGNEYSSYGKSIGKSANQVIGKTRAELYPQQRKKHPRRWASYEKAVRNKVPFNDFEVDIEADNGITYTFSLSGIPYYSEAGDFLGYRGSVRDVTEERKLQARISYAAEHDDLTGLPNRTKFAQYVDRSLAATKATDQQCVLGFLDLDGFKIVNDTVGHSVGDKLLVQCAGIFERIVGEPHRIARLGGDEFGFLLMNSTVDEAKRIFEKVISAVFRNKFVHDDRYLEVGASIGVVVINKDSESREVLMSQADVACYAAKDNGRNQVYVFSESDEDARRRHREVRAASEIQQALSEDRMLIYAQPIVDLSVADNPPVYNEILIRMKDTDGSIISPNSFIPAVERFQLAEVLDRHVINAALKLLSQYHDKGSCDCAGVSINLSGDTLCVPDFDRFVLDALERHDILPGNVCFEITETAAIRNLDVAIRFIESTRALGCRFSLDDFGAGLSSFAYLKDFNINQIKIDGRFIRNVLNDQFDKDIVSAITQIGSSLGVSVVAEHVEDQVSANMLKKLGVDYGQGFLWGKPIPYQQLLDQQQR